jgi:hypothetical protein
VLSHLSRPSLSCLRSPSHTCRSSSLSLLACFMISPPFAARFPNLLSTDPDLCCSPIHFYSPHHYYDYLYTHWLLQQHLAANRKKKKKNLVFNMPTSRMVYRRENKNHYYTNHHRTCKCVWLRTRCLGTIGRSVRLLLFAWNTRTAWERKHVKALNNKTRTRNGDRKYIV